MRTHHTCLSCPFSTPLCQLRRRLPTSILRLPKTKRHIPILNHMLYLPPHYHTLSATNSLTSTHNRTPRLTRQRKQYQPIHHQHGPKHRQIKHLKPTRQKPNHHRPRRTMPELKLRQPSYKRSETLHLASSAGWIARLPSLHRWSCRGRGRIWVVEMRERGLGGRCPGSRRRCTSLGR